MNVIARNRLWDRTHKISLVCLHGLSYRSPALYYRRAWVSHQFLVKLHCTLQLEKGKESLIMIGGPLLAHHRPRRIHVYNKAKKLGLGGQSDEWVLILEGIGAWGTLITPACNFRFRLLLGRQKRRMTFLPEDNSANNNQALTWKGSHSVTFFRVISAFYGTAL